MALPTNAPLQKRDLIAFDVRASLPIAVNVLRKRLRPRHVAVVLFRYGASSVRDPLEGISGEGWPADKEVLVRHQFRAAMRIDDALSGLEFLTQAEHHAIVAEIIADTGARFLEANLDLPAPQDWHAATPEERGTFVRGTLGQFANADVDRIYADEPNMLGFDVCVCRFQQLANAVGRPHLAPMFCAADSVHFARADLPVQLRRTATIATGGDRCDFRFDFRSDDS